MPYKRKQRKYKRRKRYGRKKKSVWKVAKAAARSVIKAQADPMFAQTLIGGYDAQQGVYTLPQPLVPGPNNGVLLGALPKIVQVNAAGDIGNPGTRKDDQILVSGIKARFRLFFPQQTSTANISIYLFLDKKGTALPIMFNTPDQSTMLRTQQAVMQELKFVKILKMKKYVFKHASVNLNLNDNFRDVDLYWKPKTPFKLKYSGGGPADFLNSRFGICFKTSYDPQNPVSVGGSIVTYYRDL